MKRNRFLVALAVFGGVVLLSLALVLGAATLSDRVTLPSFGEKVGVLEIEGAVSSSREIIEEILRFKEDSSIKSIVLRIDSPGGGVGPSQEIYDEVKKLTESKPVVVSMGAVAASGGYYVAAPAHRIVANPGTITGSLGVIMEFANYQDLLDKIGLDLEVVKSGEHKDIGSPVRSMTKDDRQILQNLIEDVHDQFIHAVADGRQMDVKKVTELADGRIFTGRQALEAGLVDELGNLQHAIAIAAELAGIAGKPDVIYSSRDRTGLFENFIQQTLSEVKKELQQNAPGLQFLWSEVH